MNIFKNPSIYNSCHKILKTLYSQHKNINKAARIVILENSVHPILIESLKEILYINMNKDRISISAINNKFQNLLFSLTVVSSQLTFMLNNRTINKSLYEAIFILIEAYYLEINKWRKYIINNRNKKDNSNNIE